MRARKLLITSLALLILSGCRPTVQEVVTQIPPSSAPYIIEFRNEGWIDGAILAQSYENQTKYIKVTNYYDRLGFHESSKYIPKDWIIEIKIRKY